MDRILRAEIVAEVKQTVAEAMEVYNERWLTGEQLMEQFGFITKDWLKKYGDTLPRERMEVVDRNGELKCSHWGYPLHRIQRMIANREHKRLSMLPIQKVG